jgi:hypothetical protein
MADIKKILIFTGAIALSIIFWSIFLGFSGIMEVDWLSFKSLEKLPQIVLSPWIIAFTFFMPITFGLVSGLSHSQDKIDLLTGASLGAFIGWLVYLLFFGIELKSVFLSFLVIPAIAITAGFSYFRKAEIKNLVGFRTGTESAKKGFLVFTIGIFLILTLIGLPNNEKYTKELFDGIVEKTASNMLGSKDLALAGADQALNIQRMLIVGIMNTEQFNKLRQKNDPDVKAFVAMIDATAASIDNPETKKKIADELSKSNDEIKQKINYDTIKKSSKEIELITNFYSVLVAFGVATTLAIYFNIIAANIAGVYAAITKFIIESVEKSLKNEAKKN